MFLSSKRRGEGDKTGVVNVVTDRVLSTSLFTNLNLLISLKCVYTVNPYSVTFKDKMFLCRSSGSRRTIYLRRVLLLVLNKKKRNVKPSHRNENQTEKIYYKNKVNLLLEEEWDLDNYKKDLSF